MRRFVARLLRRLVDAVDPKPISAPWSCPEEQQRARADAEAVKERLPKRGHGSDTSVPSAHVPPPRGSGATHVHHEHGVTTYTPPLHGYRGP